MTISTSPLIVKNQGQTRGQVAHHNLALYFAGAYVITWLCWGLVALAAHQLITLPVPPNLLMLLGGLGPLLMAMALSAYEGGRAGVRGLLTQLLRWRVHPLWYVIALLFPLVGILITIALTRLAGAPPPPYPPLAQWLMIPAKFVFVVLLGGGL